MEPITLIFLGGLVSGVIVGDAFDPIGLSKDDDNVVHECTTKTSRSKVYDKELNENNMRYIDYGLSILKKVSLNDYDSNGFIDLSSIYQSLIKKKVMISFEVFQRFYEIGKPSGIEETKKNLSLTNKI